MASSAAQVVAAAAMLASPPPPAPPQNAAAAAQHHHHSLGETLQADEHILVHGVHDFFSETLPQVATIVLILLVFTLITLIVVGVARVLMRQFGAHEHVRVNTERLIAFALILLAFATAFNAVGANFGHIFLGLGLFSVALAAGFNVVFSNAGAGFMLQTSNMFEEHHDITLPTVNNISGEILSMNLRHVELRPYTLVAAGEGEEPHKLYADTTVLIPNAIMESQPVIVRWHSVRQNKRPAPSRANGASSRQNSLVNASAAVSDSGSVESRFAEVEYAAFTNDPQAGNNSARQNDDLVNRARLAIAENKGKIISGKSLISAAQQNTASWQWDVGAALESGNYTPALGRVGAPEGLGGIRRRY